MKAGAAIAEILKREGVEFLIGYPVNTIIEASAEADIRHHHRPPGAHRPPHGRRGQPRHLGDRIGVFAMQHGPGTENSFGGVAQAYGDSVPIVVLPGGYPRRIASVRAQLQLDLNYQHVTKSAEQVTLARDTIPDAMRRAFTQVRNGRPAPGPGRDPRRLWNEDVRGAARLQAGAPDAQRRRTRRRSSEVARRADRGPAAGDLRRPGRALRQGVAAAARAGRAARGAGDDAASRARAPSRRTTRCPWARAGGRSQQLAPLPDGRRRDLRHRVQLHRRPTTACPCPRARSIIHATLDPADLAKDIPIDHALIGDAD